MTDWVAPFVPNPKPEEIIYGAKKFNRSNIGYNAHFYYPRKGGCSALISAFADKVKNINFNISAQKVDYKRRILHTSDGKQRRYTNLISTQPLPELLNQIHNLPVNVKNAFSKLAWNSVLCLNISVKIKLADKSRHWIYFPEKKYAFYRAGIYTNIMPSMAPKGWRSFYVEISYKPGRKPDEEQLLAGVKHGLVEAGLIASTDSLDVVNPIYMPYAYVIYDRNRKAAVETIHEFLRKHNIYSIGRYGAWKYSFIEESITDARNLMAML